MPKTKNTSLEPIPDFSLSRLVGRPQLLPGESSDQYEQLLAELIRELEAKSPLAVMLVEQLYEALLWARRHGQDKLYLIHEKMAENFSSIGHFSESIFEALTTLSRDPSDKNAINIVDDALKEKGTTLELIRARAVRSSLNTIKEIDALINQQLNTIRHLQKSIEAIELKPRLKKRLDLQLQALERDLVAIEHDE